MVRDLSELKGRTLKVYLYLLGRGEAIGVRELQREMGFSSPSIAHYHLEKLREMGVVSKDHSGRYRASEKIDVDILRMFVMLGGRLIPRFFFYAVFMSTLTALYLLQHIFSPDPYAATFAITSSTILWYETINVWRKGVT